MLDLTIQRIISRDLCVHPDTPPGESAARGTAIYVMATAAAAVTTNRGNSRLEPMSRRIGQRLRAHAAPIAADVR
jgi:hypothetical protein